MAVKVVRFGPGTLSLGVAPGTDFSCQVQSLGVNVDKNEGDPITVLCGDQVPGSIDYTYKLAGTLLQDLVTSGIVEYSWTNAGTAVPFEYVPSTGVTGLSIAGEIVIDPMSLGTSDGAFGDVLTSDVEWTCVGKPDVTWGTGSLTTAADEQSTSEPEPVAV
jgi:hypothetical protein